jgi:hypothetical protein
MPEPLQRLVALLCENYGLDDPVAIAEVLYLWQGAGSRSGPGTGAATAEVSRPGAAPGLGPRTAQPSEDRPPADETLPVYARGPVSGGERPASMVFPHRVTEPLDGLALRRALRPMRRRWPDGRRHVLDVAETVRAYAASETLVPHFRPGPERWFDLEVVVDTSLTMAVWSSTVTELIDVLAGLGVFRGVRVWRLDDEGDLRDPHGKPAAPGTLHAADGRRLIVVLSDCTASWWYEPEPWRMIRAWARNTPTVLINPLPTTAWPRTAMNMPTVRLRTAVPGGHGRDLIETALDGADVTPLPVPALTPHALGRWARALMNGDPGGCDGALLPPDGRDPEPELEDDPDEWRPPSPVDALRVTASGQAVRLAVLCALQDSDDLDLSFFHLIRQELVAGADAEDLAEVLTGGIFDPILGDGGVVLRFRPGVREQLRSMQTPTDAWNRYRVISRHLTAETDRGDGGRFPVAVPDPSGDQLIPSGEAPVGEASQSALKRVGLRSASQPAAQPRRRKDPSRMADDPTAPVFFVSHAGRGGTSEEVRLFYRSLSDNVTELIGGEPGRDPGFLDTETTFGSPRPESLTRALGTSQVMVFLTSQLSLGSPWCAREWDLQTRRQVYDRRTGEPADVTPILPVLWTPLLRPEPPLVAAIQRFVPTGLPDPATVAFYQSEGLLGLLATGRYEDFQAVIWRLSLRIQYLNATYWVEPWGQPDTGDLHDSFERP